VFPLNLYARVRVFVHVFAHETVGAARTRYSLRPLISRAGNFQQHSGANAPRGRSRMSAFRAAGLALAISIPGTLAKAAPKGEKTLANQKYQRERQFEHQGQGLYRRDLRASDPACAR
jgi:hypothetical protein